MAIKNNIFYCILIGTCLLYPPRMLSQFCGTKIDQNTINISNQNNGRLDHNFHLKSKIQIPIKFYFIENYRSAAIFDPTDIDNKINYLNDAFQDSNIQFYLCEIPTMIKGRKLYNYRDALILYKLNNTKNVLNIYIADRIAFDIGNGQVEPISGFADFFSYVFMSQAGFKSNEILTHEIGHYLGLYHTHEILFGAEYVNGSNCFEAGDLICDTPADPNLLNFYLSIDRSCGFNEQLTDKNGDYYEPDVSNYMSYAPEACISKFSTEQFQVMDRNAFRIHSSPANNCNELELQNLNIFPNPITQGNFYLVQDNKFVNRAMTITISSIDGQIVKQEKLFKNTEKRIIIMNVDELQKGIYFLFVDYDKSDKIYSDKIFIN